MKKIIAVLLALSMACMLAACAGGSQGTTEATPAAPETTSAPESSGDEETTIDGPDETAPEAETEAEEAAGSLKVGAGNGEIIFSEGVFPVEGFNGETDTNPYVRTLLIEDKQKAAIVSLELVNTPEDVIQEIKDYIAEKTGTPQDNVWVHSNHTITTPHAPDDESKRSPFIDNVMVAAIESIDEAAESFQPAVMGVIQGECEPISTRISN